MTEPIASFSLSEAEIAPGRHEIGVEGELDLAVAGELREAIARAGSAEILIDLSHCEFIDSTGIAVIVNAHRDGAGTVLVHSACGQVSRVLDVTGLTANGLVFDTREQAIIGRSATAEG